MKFAGMCIGGPWDGKSVTRDGPVFRVAETEPMPPVSFRMEDYGTPISTKVSTHEYGFIELPYLRDNYLQVFIHSSLYGKGDKAVLEHIINGYRRLI